MKISGLITAGDKQLALVEEELDGIRGLVVEGYAPKVQQIGLEKDLIYYQKKLNLQVLRQTSNNRRTKI